MMKASLTSEPRHLRESAHGALFPFGAFFCFAVTSNHSHSFLHCTSVSRPVPTDQRRFEWGQTIPFLLCRAHDAADVKGWDGWCSLELDFDDPLWLKGDFLNSSTARAHRRSRAAPRTQTQYQRFNRSDFHRGARAHSLSRQYPHHMIALRVSSRVQRKIREQAS
jgi:hypothetical protein